MDRLTEDEIELLDQMELEDYYSSLLFEKHMKSPLDLACLLFPETERWEHVEIINEHLLALAEYRLTANGPVPPEDVEWWITWRDGAEEQVGGPWELPDGITSYEGRTPLGNVVFRLALSMRPLACNGPVTTETFPLWCLALDPTVEVALGTYSDTFAADWGGKARDLTMAAHEGNMDHLPVALPWMPEPKARNQSKDTLYTTTGPGRIVYSGRGGGLTGKGFQVMVGDDFIKNAEEGESPSVRRQLHNFYSTTWNTRKTKSKGRFPIPIEVQMATRWHVDDIIGHYAYDEDGLPRDGWCILNIPALCENPETDPLGREEGETHPSAGNETEAELFQKREEDPRTFAALYQGHPTAGGTGMLNPEFPEFTIDRNDMFVVPYDGRTYRLTKDDMFKVASLDMAAGKKDHHDYTSMLIGYYHREYDFLLMVDCFHGRIGTDEYMARLEPILAEHQMRDVTVEKVTYGNTLGQMLARAKYNVIFQGATSDKVARVTTSRLPERCFNKRLFVPRGAPWVPRLAMEFQDFPFGAHDDQVDSAAFMEKYIHDRIPKWRPPKDQKPVTLADEVEADAKRKQARRGRRGSKDVWSAIG